MRSRGEMFECFPDVIACDDETARYYLGKTNLNPERAIDLYLSPYEEHRRSSEAAAAAAAAAEATEAASTSIEGTPSASGAEALASGE
jgi:hypothetical protein